MSNSMNNRARYATLAAMALAAGLAGAAYASSDKEKDKHKDKGAETRGGQASTAAVAGNLPPMLTLDAVLARLRGAGYSDFREVEREDGHYEVKGRNAKGDRVELYVDARSGEIAKEERDD